MLLSGKNVPEFAWPSTVALEARLSHDRSGSGTMPGKCELSQSVEPGGASRLSLARSTVVQNKCTLVPALCREGLFLVYCIRSEAMKAAVYYGPGDVRIENVREPEPPGPAEVVIQVK